MLLLKPLGFYYETLPLLIMESLTSLLWKTVPDWPDESLTSLLWKTTADWPDRKPTPMLAHAHVSQKKSNSFVRRICVGTNCKQPHQRNQYARFNRIRSEQWIKILAHSNSSVEGCHTFHARDQFVNPKTRSVPTKNWEFYRARKRDIPKCIVAL